MKKELEYFRIDKSFGGNQDWFRDFWMHIGGCAAAAACDSCISIEKAGIMQGLCPFDIQNLKKSDYISFAMEMKPYLKPRLGGINRLDIYVDGFGRYLSDMNNDSLHMDMLESDRASDEAGKAVKNQINNGFPIPFLLLKHKNHNFKNLLWHWFMLVGYEEYQKELFVKIATYGDFSYASFNDLWNSGYRKNGGMILYSRK